jgi:hypothetical protein
MNRLQQCAHPSCCCAATPIQVIETLAARVRVAMETIDLTEMAELLAPDARWGAPERDVPTCRSAKEILSWYEIARENGVRASVTEVDVIGEHIVVGLRIIAPKDAASPSRISARWQVLSVEDGRIGEIRGYETRRDATAFATSGVSRWKASRHR